MPTLRVTNNPNALRDGDLSFDERAKQLEEQKKAAEDAKKREQQSPFSRWTQLNNQYTKELISLAVKYPKAHAILYFLVDQMDNYNAVMVSTQILQHVLRLSRQTISKNLQVLKELGFIVVYKSGTSNIYAVSDKVFWKSWGNNMKYSKFPANVVLSLSEQDKQIQDEVYKNIEQERLKQVGINYDQIPGQITTDDIGLTDPDADNSDSWLKDPDEVVV